MEISKRKNIEAKIIDLEIILKHKEAEESELREEIETIQRKKLDRSELTKQAIKNMIIGNAQHEIRDLEKENEDLKQRLKNAEFQASQKSGACCLLQ